MSPPTLSFFINKCDLSWSCFVLARPHTIPFNSSSSTCTYFMHRGIEPLIIPKHNLLNFSIHELHYHHACHYYSSCFFAKSKSFLHAKTSLSFSHTSSVKNSRKSASLNRSFSSTTSH